MMGPLDDQIARIRDPGQLFHGAWSLMRAHARTFVVPLIVLLTLYQTGVAGTVWFLIRSWIFPQAIMSPTTSTILGAFGSFLFALITGVSLLVFVGMGWLSFDHTLKTGEIRDLWSFARPVLHRFFPYFLTWLWFFLWVACGFLMCIFPGWIAMAYWAPAPFLALQKDTSPSRAMKLATTYTRVRVPHSRYARTGWGKLMWLIGGVQLLQACLTQSLTLAAQLAELYLMRQAKLTPGSFLAISQLMQIPVQVINGVAYALLVAGAILVYRQGILFRHAPDLHQRIDTWLEDLGAS